MSIGYYNSINIELVIQRKKYNLIYTKYHYFLKNNTLYVLLFHSFLFKL